MTKKITLRVSQRTYDRWKQAADLDYRPLALWLEHLADEKLANTPLAAAKEDKLPAEAITVHDVPAKEDKLPANAGGKINLLARMKEPGKTIFQLASERAKEES
jgi:hypothetical protein